jgi:hypothetical protein
MESLFSAFDFVNGLNVAERSNDWSRRQAAAVAVRAPVLGENI